MFGYVCINKPEMKIKDYEAYKAVYCSLCKQLSKEYSFLSAFLLNYDCTFFSLLILANEDKCPSFKKGRCRFNPLKSCSYCTHGENAFSKSAALLVSMSYYKIIDNIRDGSFFEKLGCVLIKPLFSLWMKKAKSKYPSYADACEKMYNDQIKAEEADASIDSAAEPTANLLKFVFSQEAYSDKIKPAYEQFGYHLGRWIYLMDAACDIDSDIKHKSFNPIYNKLQKPQEECAAYADELLSQSLFLLTSAYRFIDKKRFGDILDNIILLGLAKKQKELLFSERKIDR
ncbi:MAG: hypothetical protein IJ298_03005 [Ruminococcus sp.]|nr:hypothetical protein [Ruminococcus sp.]